MLQINKVPTPKNPSPSPYLTPNNKKTYFKNPYKKALSTNTPKKTHIQRKPTQSQHQWSA